MLKRRSRRSFWYTAYTPENPDKGGGKFRKMGKKRNDFIGGVIDPLES
jgi:hypothetical protein